MATQSTEVTAQLFALLKCGVETRSTLELLLAILESSDDGKLETINRKALKKIKRASRREESTSVFECAHADCGRQFCTLKRLRAHVKKKKHCADLKEVKLQYYRVLRDSVVDELEASEGHVDAAKAAFDEICEILDEMHPSRGQRASEAAKRRLESELSRASTELFEVFEAAKNEFCELNDVEALLRTLPPNFDDCEDQHEPALTLIEVETNRLRFTRRVVTLECLFAYH
jgi:hypothetical protein